MTDWILWLAGGAAGGAGAALLAWALLRDRARGRLRCPKCWYDMGSLTAATRAQGPPDSPTPTPLPRCPECGRTPRTMRDLRRTRRRWRWAALGAILLGAGVALGAWPRASRDGAWALAPTWTLRLGLQFVPDDAIADETATLAPATAGLNDYMIAERARRQIAHIRDRRAVAGPAASAGWLGLNRLKRDLSQTRPEAWRLVAPDLGALIADWSDARYPASQLADIAAAKGTAARAVAPGLRRHIRLGREVWSDHYTFSCVWRALLEVTDGSESSLRLVAKVAGAPENPHHITALHALRGWGERARKAAPILDDHLQRARDDGLLSAGELAEYSALVEMVRIARDHPPAAGPPNWTGIITGPGPLVIPPAPAGPAPGAPGPGGG